MKPRRRCHLSGLVHLFPPRPPPSLDSLVLEFIRLAAQAGRHPRRACVERGSPPRPPRIPDSLLLEFLRIAAQAGDPSVWCALERLEKAAKLFAHVHDGLERACGHLRAAAVLSVLNGGVGDDEGCGNSAVPLEQSPWFSEQLHGAMELGDAMLKAADLVTEAKAAREAAFDLISDV